jgi:nitroreductase
MMDMIEGIETRRSIRAYKATPIPREIMEKILKAAAGSPSYQNTQPWEVTVVSGEKREELSRILYNLAKSDEPENPDLPRPQVWPPELESRSIEHREDRYKALGIDPSDRQQRRESRLNTFQFFEAPCVIFLFIDRTLTSWSIFDMGLFAQNILLVAHSFGLGICLQAMLSIYPDAVREFLGIPKSKQLVIGMSIGYPDLEAKANTLISSKIGLGDFTQWYD